MNARTYYAPALLALGLVACKPTAKPEVPKTTQANTTNNASPDYPAPAKDWVVTQETHLREVAQLTNEGDNGEAYFSPDGKRLVFQSARGGYAYDQIYTMNLDGSEQKRVSNGQGRTTCSYFTPDGKAIIYSSTHLRPETPPKPEGRAAQYEWAFDTAYDVFRLDLGTGEQKQLTTATGYDAESTFSLQGDKIVFTSLRDGDAELYSMNPDGTNQTRLTNEKGYDGGPWLSPDGKSLVWRASRTADYRQLQIYIADADGKNPRALTSNSATNFAPSWHPSGNWIVFSADIDEKYNFELYRIHPDGTGLERITFAPGFDGFPVFSPDGKYLVFASNRADPNAADPRAEHDTQVFRAKWVE